MTVNGGSGVFAAGPFSNYGEMLYVESLHRMQLKQEKVTQKQCHSHVSFLPCDMTDPTRGLYSWIHTLLLQFSNNKQQAYAAQTPCNAHQS